MHHVLHSLRSHFIVYAQEEITRPAMLFSSLGACKHRVLLSC